MTRLMRRWFIWSGLVIGLSLIVWGLYAASQGSTGSAGVVPGISAQDRVSGSRTAAAVLIEYSDFQCPACQAYEPIIQQLKDKYGDRLALVYRYFPLTQLHKHAQLSSQAAEAADKQGSFWAMHDLLFDRQTSWAASLDAKPVFIGYAKELGLNVDQFTADLNSQVVKDRIAVDVRSGNAARVPGTPTFFFNGSQVLNPRGIDDFTKLIDNALRTP